MRTKTRRLTVAGLFLALGVIVPLLIHATGIEQVGGILLPMHIPVLLAGYCLGPTYGGLVGLLCPLISALFGMPPMMRLPFMMGELAAYGAISGLLATHTPLLKKRGGIYAILLPSMVAGRAVHALMVVIATYLLGINIPQAFGIVAVVVLGLPGIALQLVLIPILVYVLQKGGFLDGLSPKSH